MSPKSLEDLYPQPLSSVLHFAICPSCFIVDDDWERMTVGHRCSRCGVPSDGGHDYLGLKVSVLVDLLQFTFHAKPPRVETGWTWPEKEHNAIPTAVVIYFSTLEEILLENFLTEAMTKRGLDASQQNEEFEHFRYSKQRKEWLFPKHTGSDWRTALGQLQSMAADSANSLDAFCTEVRKVRNAFLHGGSTWVVPQDMPRDCLRNSISLLRLYVELHNHHIALESGPSR